MKRKPVLAAVSHRQCHAQLTPRRRRIFHVSHFSPDELLFFFTIDFYRGGFNGPLISAN